MQLTLGFSCEQILRVADDRFLRFRLGAVPIRRADCVQFGRSFCRTDVSTDKMRLRDGDKKFSAFGVGDDDEFGGSAFVICLRFNAEKFSDTAAGVNDVVAGGEFVEF